MIPDKRSSHAECREGGDKHDEAVDINPGNIIFKEITSGLTNKRRRGKVAGENKRQGENQCGNECLQCWQDSSKREAGAGLERLMQALRP